MKPAQRTHERTIAPMNDLMSLVPPEQRDRVHATARWLSIDTRRTADPDWVNTNPRLFEQVPATVAAIAPEAGRRDLAVLARYAVWSVQLDDAIDNASDPATLRAVVRAVYDTLAGAPAEIGGHPLMPALADLLAGLRRRGGDELSDRFVTALSDAVRAGAQHVLASRRITLSGHRPPSVEQYLPVAARDVNYRSFAIALLMVVSPRLRGKLVDRWSDALTSAEIAVRLANDVRSVDRDRRAGELNVLDLRTGDGAAVSPELVERWIDSHVARHDELVRQAAERDRDAGAGATALINCLRISVGMYRATDLR